MLRQVTLRTAQAVNGFIKKRLGEDTGYPISYLMRLTPEDTEIIDNEEFKLLIVRRNDGGYDVSLEIFATI